MLGTEWMDPSRNSNINWGTLFIGVWLCFLLVSFICIHLWFSASKLLPLKDVLSIMVTIIHLLIVILHVEGTVLNVFTQACRYQGFILWCCPDLDINSMVKFFLCILQPSKFNCSAISSKQRLYFTWKESDQWIY